MQSIKRVFDDMIADIIGNKKLSSNFSSNWTNY